LVAKTTFTFAYTLEWLPVAFGKTVFELRMM